MQLHFVKTCVVGAVVVPTCEECSLEIGIGLKESVFSSHEPGNHLVPARKELWSSGSAPSGTRAPYRHQDIMLGVAGLAEAAQSLRWVHWLGCEPWQGVSAR